MTWPFSATVIRYVIYSLAVHSISQAGVKKFKSTTKTLLRGGTKRKRSGQLNKNPKHKKLNDTPLESEVALKVNQGPGRPKMK